MALSRIDTTNMIEDVPQSKIDNNINFRNLIINGSMDLAQRGTSFSSQTAEHFVVDRFKMFVNGAIGTWTTSQSTTVPTGQGFAKSLKMDCTTADASPASTDILSVQQRFEGQNLQYLKKGTSSAESLTASFWVRSNKTGTYIAELEDRDNTRYVSQSYTISSADTWEKKTVTFPGDTSGAFTNDNGESLRLNFWLGGGATWTSGTLGTTWHTTSANRAVGQVNLADSTSNEWYVTGIQLEAGTSASDFEFLPVDVNLQRCQRYYEKNFDLATPAADGQAYGKTQTTLQSISYSTGALRHYAYFKVRKRANPTATFYYVTGLAGGSTSSRWDVYTGSWVQSSGGNTSSGEIDEQGMDINVAHSGFTFGASYLIAGGWSVDAEL